MTARASTTRRRFAQGAAIAPFFIGRSASAEDDEAKITAKLATVAPAGTPWAHQVGLFRKRVKKDSEGLIKIKAYLGGGLGEEIEAAAACKQGRVQIFAGSTGALASAVPQMEAVELPFLFSSKMTVQGEHRVLEVDRILDEVVYERIHDLLWKSGFKLLFWAENGFRSIGSKFRLEEIGQLKGKKMRSQPAQVHMDTWGAFGASPVPIPVTEVTAALETGAVDGFDNTPLFAFAASWYTEIKSFTLTEHIYQPGVAVASRKFWEKLDPGLQGIILGADAERREFTLAGRDAVRRMDKQLIDNFRTAGVEVIELETSKRDKFAEAAAAAHKKFDKRTNAEGRALLKAMKDTL